MTADEGDGGIVTPTDPSRLLARWVLVSVTTPENGPVPAEPQVTTDLTFGDGAVVGSGGVNRFRGTYETSEDGTLRIKGVAATRMAGPEPAMAQERRFFTALSTTMTFEIVGGSLTLRGADAETVAVLVRPAEDPIRD